MSHAVQFAFHQHVKASPPDTEITQLLDRAFDPAPLTRAEKDQIAHYGHVGRYDLAGWRWNMSRAYHIRRILVREAPDSGTFHTYYAPDITSLRKVLKSRLTMVYLPR